MVNWIMAQPFWAAAAGLTVVAAVRSQLTYWLGRAVRAGLVKAPWARRLASHAGQTKLERYGWPAIPLSFLTVGLQTAVNLAAGLLGWRWPRYTLAAVPGWVAWGMIYAAGGLAIWVGLAALWRNSPVVVAASIQLAVCVAVVVALVLRRRRVKELW
jgi:membrane protein DedA with SNARE-associated domain